MRYRHLGRTGLRVSPIALGTMNFGPVTGESDAHRILDLALDRGVNLIDCADVYGADANRTIGDVHKHKGRTESIVGSWLRERPSARDEVILISKAYGRMGPGPNDMYLSAAHLHRACEASLRRLGVDHLDVFMLHHVDPDTGWDELWEVLDDLRRQGKIRYAATSNFPGWKIAQGQEAAARRGLLGLVAEQSIYNLMERGVELELLPACRAYGVGVMPYSPLNSGLLGGILSKQETAARSSSARAVSRLEAARAQLQAYEELCHDLGQPPAVVGQAWLCQQPGVTAPIVGARTTDHLEAGVLAASLDLPDDVLSRLDSIFPGPGPAPEAYAW